MGWTASQRCIVGISADIEELKVVDTEAIFEEQNRYDTRTGKILKTDTVLVKDEEYHYEWLGCKGQSISSLIANAEKAFKVESFEGEETIYLGFSLGDNVNCGRIDLLQGYVSIEEVNATVKTLQEMFPKEDVGIYFMYSSG